MRAPIVDEPFDSTCERVHARTSRYKIVTYGAPNVKSSVGFLGGIRVEATAFRAEAPKHLPIAQGRGRAPARGARRRLQTTAVAFPGRVGDLDLGPLDHVIFRIANFLVGDLEGARVSARGWRPAMRAEIAVTAEELELGPGLVRVRIP